MSRLVTAETLNRTRDGYAKILTFKPSYMSKVVTFIDDTFSSIFEGERGLDGRICKFGEMQIRVTQRGLPYVLALNMQQFIQIGEALENIGHRYLSLRGKTFAISFGGSSSVDISLSS